MELVVHVDRADHRAWAASVLIDTETNHRIVPDTDAIKTTWAARLPDTGVRFTLTTIRRLPFPAAVGA
jgi:hypothetical protein